MLDFGRRKRAHTLADLTVKKFAGLSLVFSVMKPRGNHRSHANMGETPEPLPLELALGEATAVDDHSPFALTMAQSIVVETGAGSDGTSKKRKQACADELDDAAADPSAAAAAGAEVEATPEVGANAVKQNKKQEEKRRRAHLMSRSRDLYQQALHVRHQRAVAEAQKQQQQQAEQQQAEQQLAERQRMEQLLVAQRQVAQRHMLQGLLPSQHHGVPSNAILVVMNSTCEPCECSTYECQSSSSVLKCVRAYNPPRQVLAQPEWLIGGHQPGEGKGEPSTGPSSQPYTVHMHQHHRANHYDLQVSVNLQNGARLQTGAILPVGKCGWR